MHRIARTARAGAEGAAVALVADDERSDLRAIERLIRRKIDVLPLPEGLPTVPHVAERERGEAPPRGQRPARRPAQGAQPQGGRPAHATARAGAPAQGRRDDRRPAGPAGGDGPVPNWIARGPQQRPANPAGQPRARHSH